MKKYEMPEIELIKFECEDIITASGDINQDPNETPIVPGL